LVADTETLKLRIKPVKKREEMATAEENWQMKRPTVAERISFIFNNELLSDVNFVVPCRVAKPKLRR